MRVDQPGQHDAAAEVDDLVARLRGPHLRERATGDDHPVARRRCPASASARRAPPVERVLRGVEDGASVDRHGLPSAARSGRPGRLGGSRSSRRSRSAATLTAIVAGSLPVMSGQPDRRRDPGERLGVVPLRGELRRGTGPLRRRPDQPDRRRGRPQRSAASQSATSSAWSWVMISTWRAGGSSPSTSSGSPARGGRAPWPRASASTAQPRRRSSCSAPRVDQVQLDVVAGRGSGPARGRRARRRRSRPRARPQRFEQDGHLAAAALDAVLVGRLVERDVIVSGAAVAVASIARARSTAVASRLPPPMLPQRAVARDDHLGAGLARRVAAHRRHGDEHAGPAARGAAARPPPASASRPASLGRLSSAAGSDRGYRPSARVPAAARRRRRRACTAQNTASGVAGRGQLHAGARPDRTPPPPARSASRTLKASISGGSPTALEPYTAAVLGGPLEQRDAELLGHLGEARQLVGARRLRRRAGRGRPVAGVPPQVLQRQPARRPARTRPRPGRGRSAGRGCRRRRARCRRAGTGRRR